MGCIGMDQAPATGRNSLCTMPRNFPGRFGARTRIQLLSARQYARLTGVSTPTSTSRSKSPG
jgi:aconitate hydratase